MKKLILLIIITTLFSISQKTEAQVTTQDSLALVAFYNTTGGPNWTNNTNWLNGPVSTWRGVNVTDGRVDYLNQYNNNLVGSLPPEIGNLTSLKTIILEYNNLTGNIPITIGNLTNLTLLWLSDNQLSGSIPKEIGQLFNMTNLYLYNNQLSGSIPKEIGQLTNLNSLELDNNKLTGNIPTEIGQLINLRTLFLQNNQLIGSVPASFGNLIELTDLILSDNYLSGNLPSEIGLLTQIVNLSFSNNQFTGGVPSNLAQWPTLIVLELQNNKFSNLPDLSGVPYLSVFSVENNNLEFGDLEPNISILTSYSPQDSIGVTQDTTAELSMDLDSNGANILYIFKDPLLLDANSGGSQSIFKWYKDGIVLTEETNSILNVTTKGMYNWEVTNTLVPNLTLYGRSVTVNHQDPGMLADSLVLVQLFNNTDGSNWNNNANWLNGPVSSWAGIEANGRVKKVNLRNNSLIGHLPTKTEIRTILQVGKNWDHNDSTTAKANQNIDLRTLGSMTHIDIGKNGLFTFKPLKKTNGAEDDDDEISDGSWLIWALIFGGAAAGIVIAASSDNNRIALGGGTTVVNPTRASLSKTTAVNSLEYLNLSNNNSPGVISAYIGAYTNLRYLNFSGNKFSGGIPAEIGNLTKLDTLDLSNNQLGITDTSGTYLLKSTNIDSTTFEIPETITNLTNLKSLYLNNNQLSGKIPPNIGNLTKLEELNLSYNKLFGDLPPVNKGFSNLGYFGCSNNNLTDPKNILWGDYFYVDQNNNFAQGETLVHIEADNNNFGSGNNNLSKSSEINDLPNWIGDFKNLKVLNIGNNHYTGVLPAEIGKLNKLTKLDVGVNQLSGNLPEEIGNLSSLDTLNLGKNSFSGQMPLSMVNLSNLAFFNFDNTQLEIPNDSSFQNWFSNISEVVTKVDELNNTTETIPNEFALEQNYPNPFNPTTTIQYAIPHLAGQANVALGFSLRNVQLKIYDMLGREVATLVNEVKSPGTYEVKFDASQFTSGVYFYTLQSGNFSSTKKMLLMK